MLEKTKPRLESPEALFEESRGWREVHHNTREIDVSYELGELMSSVEGWADDDLIESLSSLDVESTESQRVRRVETLPPIPASDATSTPMIGLDDEISPGLRAAIRELESLDGFAALLLFEHDSLLLLYRGDDATLDEDFVKTISQEIIRDIECLEVAEEVVDIAMDVRGTTLLWQQLPQESEYYFVLVLNSGHAQRETARMMHKEVLETLARRRAELGSEAEVLARAAK